MKNLVLAILFLTACANAQQRNTVYQQLFDGPITTAPETSDVFYPIGQTQHKVIVQLFDGGGSCVGGYVDMFLEGSPSGLPGTYFTIGNPINNISVNQYDQLTAQIVADTAIPYVRLVVRSFDTTNCQVVAFYSGTLSPVAPPVPALIYPVYTFLDGVPAVNVIASTLVDARQYQTHRFFADTSNCSGGDTFTALVQTIGRPTALAPWKPLGYTNTFSFTTGDVQGAYGVGNYGQVTAYIENGTATGCDVVLYYWGTNDPPVDYGIEQYIEIGFATLTTTNSVTLVSASAVATTRQQLRGLHIQNHCAAGSITVSGSSGAFVRLDPGESVDWVLNPNVVYFENVANSNVVAAATGLTAGCTVGVNFWATSTHDVN